MKFKSLTLRIWFIISVIIFTIVFIISLAFTFIIKHNDEDKATHSLHLTHQLVLNSLTQNQFNKEIIGFVNHQGTYHFVFDKQNKQITFITGNEKKSDNPLMIKMGDLITNNDHQSLKETINDQPYLIEISHITDQSFLISYLPLDNKQNLLQVIMIGILVILLSLPLSKVIANNIAKPLKQLEGYTKRIANKEWDHDLDLKSEDEIGRLAKAMKEMKDALKLADEEEKKFLQSISHDLKTPVMVIMSYAQAIIDGMYEDSAEESASIIKNEAVRLEKKIKQVLYLNTLDYVLDNDKEREDVYLDKLLTYLIANFQAVNPDLSWILNIESKPAVLLGNPDRIRVSIENILENQLRYAQNIIQVSLKDSGSSWMIEIRNDGPLISEKDLNQIFKSLYKGDKGNFGLGLSISHKIVNFYHGNIKVENRNGQVCFTICYPKK
ncbi:sensor histidine kinase [Neobacillus ginsengisoli]|nr:HAMP domain-containing sensor histidine kinase [Neobacillus ginsengisoli]